MCSAVLSCTVTVVPSVVVALSLLATGGSLTGVTVIETVAVPLHLGSGEPLVVPLSQVLEVKESLVVSLPSWLWLKVQAALMATLSWAGFRGRVAVGVLRLCLVSL